MAGDVNPDLLHDSDCERVEFAFAHPGRSDVKRAAEHLLEQCRRHWRAYGIETAGKQHGLRPRRSAHPFQCCTQMSVNSRRAVSKSSLTLRLSRSIRICEP